MSFCSAQENSVKISDCNNIHLSPTLIQKILQNREQPKGEIQKRTGLKAERNGEKNPTCFHLNIIHPDEAIGQIFVFKFLAPSKPSAQYKLCGNV